MSQSYSIQFRNLTVQSSSTSRTILERVSLAVKPGENVLILGPSGAGKSTLMQVIAGLSDSLNGLNIEVDNLKLPSCSYVFQDPDSQFCMPYMDEELGFMLENQSVPTSEMRPIIKRILRKVGLPDQQPHTAIQTLSMGMKQRLALASAMIQNEECMILDEPSALLDPHGAEKLWEEIAKQTKGKTVIAVEHRLTEALPHMDRILLLNQNGQLIADTKPSSFFQHYRNEIKATGIWYPSAWREYTQQNPLLTSLPNKEKTMLTLTNWTLLRKKKSLVAIKQAKVYQKDWICITGVNGAGKSSFLYGLMNLLTHTGQYDINGHAVANKEDVTDRMNFVFQNPEYQFVTTSVEQELVYSATTDAQEEAVASILYQFGLAEHRQMHPYRLSVGQKRRLSVATAFVNQKAFLLLDEPTFGQDASQTFAVLNEMERFRQAGGTILMVTHDETLVEHFATQQWVIEKGQLVCRERRQERGLLG